MLESVAIAEAAITTNPLKVIPHDISYLVSPLVKNAPETTHEESIISKVAKIITDPKALYDVPALPYYYHEPDSNFRKSPRPDWDKDTFRPVWSEVKDPQSLDEWAKREGLEDLKDIYEELPASMVIESLRPAQKIEEVLRTRVNDGKIRMNQVLEVMRGFQVSQMLAEESYNNGFELIKRHLPDFVPQEKSMVIGEPSFLRQKEENGEYFGKIGDTHILVIRTVQNPFIRLEDYKITDNAGTLVPIIGAHELMHQKHAEVSPGSITGFLAGPDSALSLEFMKTHSRSVIDKIVSLEEAEAGVPSRDKFGERFRLSDAIAEGIATSAELFIDFAEARRLMRLGRREEAQLFIDTGKVRRDLLKKARETTVGLHYAVGAEEIVSALFKTMNVSELGAFLANVDMVQAFNINYSMEAFKEILKDPRKLPQKKQKD